MKYLVNDSNNPKYNLAFEEYCLKNLARNEKYLFFWINHPTIVVGKNQNTAEEINQKYISENNIDVVRRITGGGAVYHDFGNLNFSIITEEESDSNIDFEMYNESVIKALKKLGAGAELSGRNDILIDGKKISGIAQSIWKGRVLNHGTLMFDVDLSVLANALYVKEDKLKSKGIKSVRSRVTNIKDHLDQAMDIIEFRDFLLEIMFEIEGEEMEEYKLTREELDEIDQLFESKYNTEDWNFGYSPNSEYRNSKKFDAGMIDIMFDVEAGRIKDSKIYGDFFGSKDVSDIESILDGSLYEYDELKKKLWDLDLKDYFGNIERTDFIDLLFQE